MEELLDWMKYIEDVRQTRKVRNKLKDILVIVLFATLADAGGDSHVCRSLSGLSA